MSYTYNVRLFSLLACTACLLQVGAGCSGTEENTPGEKKDMDMTIRFAAKGIPITRSTDPTGPAYEQFEDGAMLGVFAYTANADDGTYTTPDLLYNGTLTKQTLEGLVSYQCNPAAHWPTTGKAMFAAYYPYNGSVAEGSITLSPQSSPGLPLISLELGKESGKIDFCVATAGPLTPAPDASSPTDIVEREENYVNFIFHRKLAEVVFRGKTTNLNDLTKLYINAVRIRNVHKAGTYDLNTDTWSTSDNVDAVSGATIKMATGGSPMPDDKFDYIINPGSANASDASIVMIPQEYDNVEFEITYTLEYLKPSGGCEYRIVGTKRTPLTVEWKPGYRYYYDLEFGFYEAESEKVNFKFDARLAGKDTPTWIEKEIETEIK